MLALTTVEDLLSSFPPLAHEPQVTYFFFRSHMPSLNNSTDAYRAILAQILHSRSMDPALMDCFSFAMACSKGQLVASRLEILDLLMLCMRYLPRHFLVLDAVDECIDSQSLIRDLLLSYRDFWTNLIIFSRPTALELATSPQIRTLSIDRNNTADIRSYSSARLNDMIEKQYFPKTLGTPGEVNKEILIYKILLGADGMFLWATLLFEYLSSRALSKRKRLDIILSIKHPERLDEMYDRIVHEMDRQNSDEKELAKRTFMWLLFARRELLPEEMKLILDPTMDADECDGEGSACDGEDFVSAAVITCGALVERTSADKLSFAHLSARDYIHRHLSTPSSPGYVPQFLKFTALEAHSLITRRCLGYVMQSLPHVRGTRNLSEVEITLHRFQFALYATFHWVEHLTQVMAELHLRREAVFSTVPANFSYFESAASALDALKLTTAFLEDSDAIKMWLQWHYLLWTAGSVTATAMKLQAFGSYSRHLEIPPNFEAEKIIKPLKALANLGLALQDIDRDWGDQLETNPNLIWQPEISSFNPNQFLESDQSIHVDVLTSARPEKPGIAQEYSQKKTVLSRDGKFLFTLSIWASK